MKYLKKKKKFASPWPFSRVTDSGRGSRPVPIRGWSLPATATIPSNAPVQRPSRPSPRRGPARSLRPFRPGSRAPAKENSFNTGGLEASRAHFFTTHPLPRSPTERWKAQHFRKGARERSNDRFVVASFFLRKAFRTNANGDKNEWQGWTWNSILIIYGTSWEFSTNFLARNRVRFWVISERNSWKNFVCDQSGNQVSVGRKYVFKKKVRVTTI